MTDPYNVVTVSGRVIPLLAPQPDDICIEDIAQGLSNVRRWVGQTRLPLSVAEHSLNVEAYAPDGVPIVERLCALVHDAPEAYLGDISWPIKQLLPEYKRVETSWLAAILQAFDLPADLPAWLPGVDMAMAVAEAQELLPANTHAYIGRVAGEQGYERSIVDGRVPLHGWGHKRAYRVYLERFKQLREGM